MVPVAGCPAVDNSRVSPVTTDHDCMSGPPAAAQARITSWARGTDNDSRAARSSAISWASAPSRVRGNPVGTPAGPMLVADGRVITPAVPWLRVPGSASLSVSVVDASALVRAPLRRRLGCRLGGPSVPGTSPPRSTVTLHTRPARSASVTTRAPSEQRPQPWPRPLPRGNSLRLRCAVAPGHQQPCPMMAVRTP